MIGDQIWKGFETKFVLAPSIIIGVAIFLAYAYADQIPEIVRTIGEIDYGTMLVVLFLSLINYVIRFFRWAAFVLKPGDHVPVWRHFLIYIAGFSLTATPGKVGEAMRTFYLSRYGVSHQRCLAGVYAERLYDMIVISMMAMLIFTTSGTIGRSLGIVGAGLTLALIALQHPAVSAMAERIAARIPVRRIRPLVAAATGFLADARSMMTRRILTIGLGTGLLAWGAEGLGAWLVAQSLGIDIGIAPAVGIYATAMLAGALSFLPGGLGSAEVVMVSLFVYAGAPMPSAIAATAIIRLATLWFAIVLGLGTWFWIEMLRDPRPGDGGRTKGSPISHAVSSRSANDPAD